MKRYFTSAFEHGWSVPLVIHEGHDTEMAYSYRKDGTKYSRYHPLYTILEFVAQKFVKEISADEAAKLVDNSTKIVDTQNTKQKPMNNTRLNHLNQRRTKTGQFAPSKPKTLRRGSLYKVADGNIGRFRNVAFGDFVVLSNHNLPFFAKRQELRFADTAEVNRYLGK